MELQISQKNFAALSEKVHRIVAPYHWRQRHGMEFVYLLLRALLFASGFLIFAQSGIIFKILGLFIISYAYYGIGITGTHETRHGAFVQSSLWNKVWAYFFSDFWAGQSNEWWYHRHVVVHHPFTNIPSKDKQIFYYPWINPYIYFFVTPYLVAFWLLFYSVKFLWGRWAKLAAFLVIQTLGWLFHIALFAQIVHFLGIAFVCAFLMRAIFAPIFMHLAVFNHLGLDGPVKRPPWLPHQTRTTRNLKHHWFLNGMGGNAFIECHIEHHLFPTLSNCMLAKIRPVVTQFLKKEGYTYIEETYDQCLKFCLRNYHTIFKQSPLETV